MIRDNLNFLLGLRHKIDIPMGSVFSKVTNLNYNNITVNIINVEIRVLSVLATNTWFSES